MAAAYHHGHDATPHPRIGRFRAHRDDFDPDEIELDVDLDAINHGGWAPEWLRDRFRRPGWKGAGILVLLVAVSLGALGLFVQTNESGDGEGWSLSGTGLLWDGFLRNRGREGPPIGGITLGLSPSAVRGTHPNLAMAEDELGDTVGAFHFEGALYNVWFADLPTGDKAYRIQYSQDFFSLSEADLLSRMRERYGPPVVSECRSAGPATRRGCHLRWWVGDNQALDAVTRTRATADGGVKTTLTMTLIDTDLDAKRVHLLPAAGPED